MDVHFEEDNRCETELLLREAQLLIQKQHDQEDSVHLLSVNETNNAESGGTEQAVAQRIGTGSQGCTGNAGEFEDQYGGDDDFIDGEEDEEDDHEKFEQYASDSDDVAGDGAIHLTPSSKRSESPSRKETASAEGLQSGSVDSNTAAMTIISVVDDAKVLRSEEPAADRQATSKSIEPVNEKKAVDFSQVEQLATQSSPHSQSASSKSPADAGFVAKHPVASIPRRPAPSANAPHTESRAGGRPSRPVAVEKDKQVPEHPARSSSPKKVALTRERPRELRLKTMKSAVQQPSAIEPSENSKQALPRPTRTKSDSGMAVETKEAEVRDPEASLAAENSSSSLTTEFIHVAMVRPRSSPKSPGSAAGAPSRSPERVATYTPRVHVEEYELPLRKAPVSKQPKPHRIDLPHMDKTKRDWLFLNMFRHGDDVSKYESFVPKLVVAAPSKPTSLHRPYSAHMSYASGQEDAIYAYAGGWHLRSGRRLVQKDPAFRERERNWAPIKPHESAIPPYDSILDKFCATVTSPVIQRQIYQTRLNDLSPQLAYVLEKRVEKQWKQAGAAEAFGAVSTLCKADIVALSSDTDTN